MMMIIIICNPGHSAWRRAGRRWLSTWTSSSIAGKWANTATSTAFRFFFFYVISFCFAVLCLYDFMLLKKKTTLKAVEVAEFPLLISVYLCVCACVTVSLFSSV